MRVLGQFRDAGDPDEFIWVRWFSDLATRGVALPGSYHDAVVEFFDGTVLPLLELAGARSLALWQTEYAANNFPALPVREQVHVLVSFASFPDRDAVAGHHDRLAGLRAWTDDIQPRLPADVERFQLVPTNRSILR